VPLLERRADPDCHPDPRCATIRGPAVREAAPAAAVSPRNVAVDAYRGLVMLLMMAEVLELSRVSAAYPTS
jgi:hypothetical protein